MDRPDWAPDDVDITRPNAARAYDYALGGNHNFQVDRDFVDEAEARMPGARLAAHANRAFLRRAVRHMIDAGVRQFLDIGSGIPTRGNVHEVAQQAAPDARVVYVDLDPIAVAHGRSLLAGSELATSIAGDLRYPDRILRHPEVATLLDFSRPIGVLLMAVLHFVADEDDPAGIVSRLASVMVPGSWLALSHATATGAAARREPEHRELRKLYQRTPTPLHVRTPQEIVALLQAAGLTLLDPGVVPVTRWRPEPDPDDEFPDQPTMLAAAARRD